MFHVEHKKKSAHNNNQLKLLSSDPDLIPNIIVAQKNYTTTYKKKQINIYQCSTWNIGIKYFPGNIYKENKKRYKIMNLSRKSRH